MVVNALAQVDAAEVETQGNATGAPQAAREAMDHLVVERAAVQGVGVADERGFARWPGLGLFEDGLKAAGGAEIVFNPSATVAGLSEYLWKLEQPAHAVANGYWVGAINRPGWEDPWRIGEVYGQSYFCNPRGQLVATACRDKDEIVLADIDLDMIREVRNTWQFYRDRRPETYGAITAP